MAVVDILARLRPMRRELELGASFEAPIRAEVFGIERLETFARALAESDRVDPRLRGLPLLPRFYQNRKLLLLAQRRFAAEARQGRTLPPAAEWLLDNFYIIQDHLYQIEHDLSGGYYRELPKLTAGPQAGFPRVYGLALELLGHTDSRLDLEVIMRFVQAYQAVAPLNSGELWAVAIMLRIGLIENLRRLISQSLVAHQRRQAAGEWADRVLRLAGGSDTGVAAALGELAQGVVGLDSAFVVSVLERLRDQSPAVAPVVQWLEAWLGERGTNLDVVTRAEHQVRASNRLSVANVVTSLRVLSVIDWAEFFESTSLLERQLRLDPLGVYGGMDFETRDRYRHVVERLSRGARLEETEVARRALAHARRYLVGQGGEVIADADLGALREAHVGYYLVDAGRRGLERDLGYRPTLGEALRGAATQHASLVYLGSITVLTVGFVWLALGYAAGNGLGPLGLAGLALLSLLPASALAANTVNYWATILLPPASLPKLDYKAGVPPVFRTMVVVPALLSDLDGLQRLFDNLEIRCLANRDPHVQFALLCDFSDAPHQHQPEDPALLEAAARLVAELNGRHGQGGTGPFYFFNRERSWNAGEGVWMGWERKRGKLLEFNRLLRGAKNTHYTTCLGDLSILGQVRFVLDLDADTDLPINTARRLVGAMAHPLNRPRLDREARLVVGGYGILQPRVAVNALAATATRFARLFAGETGLDPYSAAVSTVYQDLFGRGNYIGKAIYDVDTALVVLDNRFPENLLLSHDLLEGSYVRAGQVTEIQLLEDFPTGYDTFTQRQHRWTRGDWQITDWLLPSVPGPGGRRLRNPLPLIARWQIFDNLRLSLVPPAIVALLAFSWTVLPGSPLAWTTAALLPMYANELLGLVLSSAVHPPGEPWLAYLRGVANDAALGLGRVLFQVACLPHAALVNLDAIGRVIARRAVTHRGLLEWTSAAAAEGGQARRLLGFWAHMWPAAAVAAFLLGLVAMLATASLPAALPLAGLWLLAPFLANWLSQPSTDRARRPLPLAAQAELRRTARRIWHFYEIFSGPEENWLPPDNFQLEPNGIIAHRTSPTNIGFLLLSALAAHDFGFLDGFSLLDRLERTFATLEKLRRFRGHLFNWYQTQSLQALGPEYISTVDSGNLAACLLVVKQACLQAGAWTVAPPAGLSGLRDTLAELLEVFRRYPPQVPAAQSAAKELMAAAEGVMQVLPGTATGPDWLRSLERMEREASALAQRAQSLAATRGASDAGPLIGWTESLLGQVRGWRRWAEQLLGPAGTEAAGDRSVEQVAAEAGGPAAMAARDLRARAAALAARAESLAAGMDFGYLFSPERGVFSIGYNLSAQALDNSFYDLLASEARLASLVAVARGQVPARHWFRLGRPLTWAGETLAVLSWGGTMFEYLMPSLLVRDYPATLLAQTAGAVVRAQRRFGEARRVPWGVSESGFYAFDYQLNYQYQSFGVPELALRRDQADNLVIAPYATFLALPVDPAGAWDNLQRLAREGAAGPYGYFEALDYTPSRRPRGQSVAVVASFMAHHQGMSLVALDNFLNDGPMLRRFHSEASIAAVELLLQERVPRHVPVLEPHPDGETDQSGESGPLDTVRKASVRWFSTPHTPNPRTHVLSNSSYEVMVTNAGGGYSHYNDPVSGRTVAVTRWRPDFTMDDWGTFIYLQDTASGQSWSATYQPTAREPDGYEASYSVDRVEFRRRDLGIESHLEIVVSPRESVEIRRVTLTNRSRRSRTLALTSFAELVLDTPEADLAHPAFGKLFVESEYLDERHALLFRRRPRAASQPHPWGLHLVVADRPLAGPVEYETDRARFLGRGQSARRPAALRGPLSNTTGAVLDPVMSLRASLKLAPAEVATVVFVTGVGADREAVLALADKYHDPRIVESTQELAWVYSQIQLRHLGITDEDAHLFQRLASRILYPDLALRAPTEILMQNRRGQSALWAYGLSGDNPIVLVEVDEDGELDLARQLLRAHEYWRLNNFVVDLVILNEHATSYAEGLEGQLRALINTSLSHPWLDRPGGVFVRRADHMPAEDQVLLKTVARVVLDADAGTLLEQIERSVRETPAVAPPSAPQRPEPAVSAPPSPGPKRLFDNGLGGFSADGREYVISLAGDEWTPMPWANVLANENFGCLVSEAGLGCTWAENSQQNRLTPWSNDPVRDPPGEALYLRDEATGESWTPTPLPMRALSGARYTVAHGAGYTRYEHTSHDLAQELLVFVPRDDPVKVMRLRLRNLGRQPRQVAVSGYADWVLGVTRAQSQHFVISERDAHSGALLARNHYNTPFAERVAFAHLIPPGGAAHGRGGKGKEPSVTCTADRTEFIGRNRSLAQPAGLDSGALSGKVGAGLDPCAALQTKLTINPREAIEVIFLLGQGTDAAQAGALAARYSDPVEVERALKAVIAFWDDLLGAVQVRTPDPALDLMLNRWLLYQATVCRIWGRTAFYQSGGAYGFRDQLQDVLALLHARPDLARAHLLRAAARQFVEGDAQHWWHPNTNQGVRTLFSDDFLWLPYAVATYVSVTGDAAVLDEAVPFLSAPLLGPGEHEAFVHAQPAAEASSLYEHCTRALDHGLRFGPHGLPLMGIGDWNDGMNQVGVMGKGESVWLGWFLLANLQAIAALARQRGDLPAAERYEQACTPLTRALQDHGWDGQWYRRAYFDDGTPLGSAQNEECRIDSIAQSWAVISGGAPPDRARQALESADGHLVLPEVKLSLLLTPPFNRSQPDPGYIQGYIPGTRENGGQYTHAALWLVLAHAMQGDGERAAELYAMANPINHALTPEDVARYKVEPYVVAADIYAHPAHLGRGGWTWYTGSAGWMYRVGLEGLLGLRRHAQSLSFAPCLPKDWPGFELTYRYGKARYEIKVENGAGKVISLLLDGHKQDGVELPLVDDGRVHSVRVGWGG